MASILSLIGRDQTKELLVVMILLGKEFTIVTDHLALQWLNKHKGDNAYLMKWSLALQEYYPFEIKWRPGRKHGAPDTLSRFPVEDDTINLLYLDNNSIFKGRHIAK
jgi:hypothetical protein